MLINIRRWLASPDFEGEEEKSRTATLLDLILWTFILAAPAYVIFAPIDPGVQLRRAGIIFTFALVMALSKQMVNRGYVRTVGNLIVLSLRTLFTVAMFFGADHNNPAFMGYVLVVVCAGLVLNWRAATVWGLLSIFTSGVFLILGENGLLPHSVPVHPIAFWVAQTSYVLVSTLLISQAIRKIDESFARASRELNERKRVEAEREKIIKELETKNTELERFTRAPTIEIGARDQTQGPVFFVRDNGIGIESARHEKTFGLFDKLSPHSAGTGMGLALARRILEVHGGSLWVELEGIRKGSVFCFTLPVKEGSLGISLTDNQN